MSNATRRQHGRRSWTSRAAGRVRRLVRDRHERHSNRRELGALTPPERALAWLRRHECRGGGIAVHSLRLTGYPEVSGYLIPTLLAYGEHELALRLTRWLVGAQRGDGAGTDPEGTKTIFDTGQILRGFLAMADRVPEASRAAERNAAYLIGQLVDHGRGGFGPRYDGRVPESVHLYVLPPLLAAARRFARPDWAEAVRGAVDFYLAQPDVLQVGRLTHFLGYEIEALIDLEAADRVSRLLQDIASLQTADGAVRGVADERWVCTPGLAQLAICWYKTGNWAAADKALAWLESQQTASGGFKGSVGSKAAYFPDAELSWAVKFYLDANLLRVREFMDRNVDSFPAEVSAHDGRARALIGLIRAGDRVLEVGCGKGRFLEVIRQQVPDVECVGVDISRLALAALPAGISGIEGTLERVPLEDDGFDVVFSVEALEHSANRPAAVREMTRLARPGGYVVAIDKQLSHWGRLTCPPWESWPDAADLERDLRAGCDEVAHEPVAYDRHSADGLMVLWQGRKRSRLTGAGWSEVLLSAADRDEVVQRVRQCHLSPWAEEILWRTLPGDRVLEVGSGTGEISLLLAQAGRIVTMLDLSERSLAFARECAQGLGVDVRAVCGDALRPLAFSDASFDCVWSSGLLEHFGDDDRRGMLREWGRVSADRVILLTPNASSVAYRAGKALQEAEGRWPYGLEMPRRSFVDDFAAAGLAVTDEFSIGAKHALQFVPRQHPLRRELERWLSSMTPAEQVDTNQGYLLITCGRPIRPDESR